MTEEIEQAEWSLQSARRLMILIIEDISRYEKQLALFRLIEFCNKGVYPE